MFHSTAFADTDEKKENRDKLVSFIQRNGVELFAKSFVQPLFYRHRREEFAKEIAALQETVIKTSKEAIFGSIEAMKSRPDRTEVLKKANYPVLYIIGNQDLAVPLEQSKAQCYIAQDSTAYFLENVAHMGMIEERAKTTETLKYFTEKCQNESLFNM